MDQAITSTISALAGTVIGGVTSFATSWVSQTAEARRQRLQAEFSRRETVYVRFLDEMSKVYAHAVSEAEVDYSKLVGIFAIKGHIHLFASQPVANCADRCMRQLVDMYIAPNPTPAEIQQRMEDIHNDPLREFAAVCRAELQQLTV